jgi:hypothetical protein
MDGYDATRQIGELGQLKSDQIHPSQKLFLVGKLANTFHQILIRRTIIGHHFTHGRDDMEGIGVVDLTKDRIGNMRKFQAHESSTRLEHTECLLQALVLFQLYIIILYINMEATKDSKRVENGTPSLQLTTNPISSLLLNIITHHISDIAQSKGNSIQIKCVIWKVQTLSITLYK